MKETLTVAIILTILSIVYWGIVIFGLIKYKKVKGRDAICFMNLNSDFWHVIGCMWIYGGIVSFVSIVFWLSYFGVII